MGGPIGRVSGNSRKIAATAVFTAFVASATALFAVNLPLGYFNVGEIMVYTTALLMGPYVGGFAGGVGSMISDLTLGYPQYAPGTLVIKGTEGFTVGFLSSRGFAKMSGTAWRVTTVAVGAAIAAALGYVGTSYLTGTTSITVGGSWGVPGFTTDLELPGAFWVALAALVFVVVAAIGVLTESGAGKMVVSVLIGGIELVVGYFLYETFVLQLGSYPPTEVPFNVAQALIGLIVAVPLVRSARKLAGGRKMPASPQGTASS